MFIHVPKCRVVPRFLIILVLLTKAASAQVGTTTGIITGTVTHINHHQVPDAEVQVTSLETQVSRNRITDPRGHFTIAFPDGGGRYQLLVRPAGARGPTHCQCAIEAGRCRDCPDRGDCRKKSGSWAIPDAQGLLARL